MTFIGTTNFYLEVVKGNVPGHSLVHKFGRNPDIDTASNFEAIWNNGGDYLGFDSTDAEAVEVFSSVAADAGTVLSSGTATGGSTATLVDSGANFSGDGAAVGDIILNDSISDHGIITAVAATTLAVRRMQEGGTNASGNSYRIVTPASTGAAVVKLPRLLDDNYVLSDPEYIVLNGTTGVDTSNTYLRCSRMKVVLAGSGNGNAGTIKARQTTTKSNIFALMPVGNNQTMIACDTIPAAKTGFMLGWYTSIAKKQASFSNVRLLTRSVGEVFEVKEEYTIASTGTSYVFRNYIAPNDNANLPAMTDIKIMADTSAENSAVSAGFDLLLVDDPDTEP